MHAPSPTLRGWGSHAAMRPHLDDDHAAGTLHVCARCLLAYCAARNLDHSGRATMAAILAVDRPPVLHQILVVGSLMIAISSGPTADQRISGSDSPTIMSRCGWRPSWLSLSQSFGMCPKELGGAWAQCLAQALGRVAADNSPQAWRMLLKAVLRPAPRGCGPQPLAGMPVHNPAVQPVAGGCKVNGKSSGNCLRREDANVGTMLRMMGLLLLVLSQAESQTSQSQPCSGTAPSTGATPGPGRPGAFHR